VETVVTGETVVREETEDMVVRAETGDVEALVECIREDSEVTRALTVQGEQGVRVAAAELVVLEAGVRVAQSTTLES
jgi:hypothetical protein